MEGKKTTRTVFYYGKQDVRVEELAIPTIGSREVLVQTKACGLCGGETMDWYHSLPKILGHEPTGVIVETGSEVADYKPGDRVFVHHHAPCMSCHFCRRGSYTLCEQYKQNCLDPGGMTEYFRVAEPSLRYDTHKLPDSVSFEAGTLIEPIACNLKGIRSLGIQPGDTIAVVGTGFMGMSYIELLSMSQAGKIVALDFNNWRLERAMQMGATHTINPKNENPGEVLREITNGRLADGVVLTAPITDAWLDALRLVEKGGTFQAAAPIPPDNPVSVDVNDLYFREITLNSTFSASHRDTAAVLELLVSGRIKVDSLITHRFSFDEVQKALDLLIEADKSMKCVVVP